jgi:Na+/proline symporter
MKVLVIIPFLVYLSLLFLFGIYFSRRISSGKPGIFAPVGKMNRFAIPLSSLVSARGVWLMLAVTAEAYIIGISAVWLVTGYILAELILFLVLAPVLRRHSEIYGCISITDVFTSLFKNHKKTISLLVSLSMVFFSFIFICTQFIAGGKAFNAFLGLTLTQGIIITGIIVCTFMFFFRLKTLLISDIFHSILILLILLSVPVYILIRRDGLGAIHDEILLNTTNFFDFKAMSLGTLIGFLSVGLGSAGNPNILERYMLIKDVKEIRSMALIGTLASVLMAAGALFTGILARAYFPASDSVPGADPRNVFAGISGMILSLPTAGLVLIAIIGAVLSSSGSLLLVSASSLVNDIYRKILLKGKKTSPAKLSFYSGIIIVFLVYLAILGGIYTDTDTDIYRMMLFAMAGLGASIGPALILGLLWDNVTDTGIIAGISAGAIATVLWKISTDFSSVLTEFAPAFLASVFAIMIVSTTDRSIMLWKHNRRARYSDFKNSGPVN